MLHCDRRWRDVAETDAPPAGGHAPWPRGALRHRRPRTRRLRQAAAAADAAADGRLRRAADRAGDLTTELPGRVSAMEIFGRAAAGQRRHPPARLHRGLAGPGRPGALRDRGFALSRRRARAPRASSPRPRPTSARPSCRPTASPAGGHRTASASRTPTTPGRRGPGQGRRGRRARCAERGPGQPRLHPHPRADLRPDRPFAVHARRSGAERPEPSALATIQRMDQVYVDVTQSAADLLSLRAAMSGGGITRPARTARRCS
jgi:hypothetical protein